MNAVADPILWTSEWLCYKILEFLITKTNNILRKPLYNDQLLGCHAVLIIGYNDLNKTLIVINSHGEDWGDHGKFYMSYDMITDDKLLFETWVINT